MLNLFICSSVKICISKLLLIIISYYFFEINKLGTKIYSNAWYKCSVNHNLLVEKHKALGVSLQKEEMPGFLVAWPSSHTPCRDLQRLGHRPQRNHTEDNKSEGRTFQGILLSWLGSTNPTPNFRVVFFFLPRLNACHWFDRIYSGEVHLDMYCKVTQKQNFCI